MERLVKSLEKLAPEALEIARTRYRVLKEIMINQPIGRRQIALRLDLSERAARGEIEVLREMGALEITSAGIVLTHYGMELLNEFDRLAPYLEGLKSLERALLNHLRLDQVIVVPGDSFTEPLVKKDLGRAAARYVRGLLFPGCTLAVTGGTTLAEMAQAMAHTPAGEGVLVLPARGGLGEEVEEQANTIAAHIAKAIGGQYRLLHVPDSLDPDTINRLMENPRVAEIVERLKQCDILVHGIGSALEMACRRGLRDEALRILEEKEAVGEAFRYYFNSAGEIVYCLPGIGLELEDLKSIPHVVAVAGGSNKARAIAAALANRRRGTLITDEGAARKILEGR